MDFLAEAVALVVEGPQAVGKKHYLERSFQMHDITLLSEDTFFEQMTERVIPFINSHKTVHAVESIQGGNIHVETLVPDGEFHSVLVIFHGFCEFCAKYDEFSYYALQQGYAICRFDHRGHGFSPREKSVEDNPSKVHIENFSTYVTDAKSVVDNIAKPLANRKPLFLFGHSMGGAIGAVYLTKHTEDFTAAILNSPMMQVYLLGFPLWLGYPITHIVRLVKGNTTLNPAHREFPFDDLIFDTVKHSATSKNRHSFFYKIRYTDKRIQTWGGTMRWLCECLKAIKYIQRKRNAKKIATPILLLQAEYDATVMPKGQNNFAKKVQTCTLEIIKDANHEPFIGKNTISLPWYKKIFEFYKI